MCYVVYITLKNALESDERAMRLREGHMLLKALSRCSYDCPQISWQLLLSTQCSMWDKCCVSFPVSQPSSFPHGLCSWQLAVIEGCEYHYNSMLRNPTPRRRPFHRWSAIRAKALEQLCVWGLQLSGEPPPPPLFTSFPSSHGPASHTDSANHSRRNCMWLRHANCPVWYRLRLRPLT